MSLVLDSSVALAWLYDEERTPAIDGLLDRVAESGAWVPAIWRLEVGNSLHQAVRRRRISREQRDQSLADLADLKIQTDPETDLHAWSRTLSLAERFDLTLYDAAYLEIAERRNLPVASLDREIRAAGQALGVALLGL